MSFESLRKPDTAETDLVFTRQDFTMLACGFRRA
jgi:hypothetical protein